jgi:hypothetical protein
VESHVGCDPEKLILIMQAILEKRRQEIEKKDRVKAGILAFLSFSGVVVLCFFLVAFTKSIPPPGEQFVAVGFADVGEVSEASGNVESEVPSETVEEVVQPETAQSESVETPAVEEVVTQVESEVSVPSNPDPVSTPEPDPEPERQLNSRLSNAFNALAQSGGGGSEGAAESGAGNEGADDGRIDGRGVVSGDNGDFSLDGGKIKGYPIQEEIPNKEGVVRVKIVVDKYGKVTSATYDGAGSSTADSELIEMACRAAKTTTWTENLARPIRTGFVTIRFELE